MNIFVIAGPSGVGKSHLIHELTKRGIYPLEVYTDRVRRPTEKVITDRVYLSRSEFDRAGEEFLYWFEFQGSRYGYKRSDIQRLEQQNNSLCFNITPTHLPELLKVLPRAVVIFLMVKLENFGMLFERMVKREVSLKDSAGVKAVKMNKIRDRLDFARKEVDNYRNIQKVLSGNPLGRIFVVRNNDTLYEEVLPYILKLK